MMSTSNSTHGHRKSLVWRTIAALVLGLIVLAPVHAVAAQPDKPVPYYVVPADKQVTLKDVARTTLGDERRWQEILTLNTGREQPDGGAVTGSDGLRPGWVLVLPPDARSGEIRIGAPPTRTRNPPAGGQQTGRGQAPVEAGQAPPRPVERVTFLGMEPAVAASVGGGALLVVGGAVTGFLLWRRRKPKPVSQSAVTDPVPKMVVDRALRHIAAGGGPLPQIYGAIVGPDRVSLRLTPPLAQVPHPWRTREEGAVWEAPSWQLDPTTPNVPPPFPLLVAVGTIGGEWTAVNLGRAPGLVSLTGSTSGIAQAAAAILEQVAADPATEITVIGRPPSRARIAPGRVRVLSSVTDLLGTNRIPNPNVTGMLTAGWGAPGALPGPLERHFVLVNGPVPPADLDLLGEVAGLPGSSGAALVVGDAATAAWRFAAAEDGSLDISVLGLELDSGEPAVSEA
jgi:hypothetical protein